MSTSSVFPPLSTTAPTSSRVAPSTNTGWLLRLCTTVATVLCLAFAAQHTLSCLVTFDAREQSTFVIQALGKDDAGPEAVHPQLLLKALITDGQLLRWKAGDPPSSWEVVDRSVMPSYLSYRQSAQPALLTFQGRTALTVLQADQWSGVVRVERNGRVGQTVDIQALEGQQERPIVVEDPVAPPTIAVFVGALVVFAACAWWFSPIRTDRRSVLWLLFFLSILHLLFWASQCVGTTNDSPGYLDTVSQFFLQGQPSYFPPGYPALLGLVGELTGASLGRGITLVQHSMVVLGGLWLYLLLRRLLPEALALLGGILAGALPPSLTISQTVMSETPTFFAMVGVLYCTVRAAETGRLPFTILAGVLTGWAGTLRVVPLAALLPVLWLIHVLPPTKDGFRRLSLTVSLAMAVVLLPILWCWYNSGQPMLTNSVGFHLFNRVVTEQKQLDADGPATRV